jgi:hypothetical protein
MPKGITTEIDLREYKEIQAKLAPFLYVMTCLFQSPLLIKELG